MSEDETEEEFIESRVLPILEKEEKARIKNFQKIYGKKQKNKIVVNESEFRHGTAQEYLDTEFDY